MVHIPGFLSDIPRSKVDINGIDTAVQDACQRSSTCVTSSLIGRDGHQSGIDVDRCTAGRRKIRYSCTRRWHI